MWCTDTNQDKYHLSFAKQTASNRHSLAAPCLNVSLSVSVSASSSFCLSGCLATSVSVSHCLFPPLVHSSTFCLCLDSWLPLCLFATLCCCHAHLSVCFFLEVSLLPCLCQSSSLCIYSALLHPSVWLSVCLSVQQCLSVWWNLYLAVTQTSSFFRHTSDSQRIVSI